MARGDDLAFEFEQVVDDRREPPVGGEQPGVPLGLSPKRKFSPIATWVAPSMATRTWSMNSSAPSGAKAASKGTTISS